MFDSKVSLPKSTEENGTHRMVIDWPVLREIVGGFAFNDSHPSIIRNAQKMRESATNPRTAFHGYTKTDLRSWIRNGYSADFSTSLAATPVREKRRYEYAEEHEEIHVDRVLSGEDNYMGGFTRRTIIPGVAVEADVMFSSATPARVVTAYNVFLCSVIQSLEMSGIDCEVTVNFQSNGSIGGSSANVANVVRVKRENEASDFGSFSPMLSPAALRTFGFAAIITHNEIRGTLAPWGLGHGHGDNAFRVEYDEKTGRIRLRCQYHGAMEFPKMKMEEEFALALKEITG